MNPRTGNPSTNSLGVVSFMNFMRRMNHNFTLATGIAAFWLGAALLIAVLPSSCGEPLLAPAQYRALVQLSTAWPTAWNFTSSGGRLPRQCSRWEGVECNNRGQIISLDVAEMFIEATIPRVISTLTALTDLNLGSNLLSGILPLNYFSGMNALTFLNLCCNQFSATSGRLGTMPSLEYLQLQGSRTAAIHIRNAESISAVRSLTSLNVADTFLPSIPSAWSTLTNLQTLSLSNLFNTTGTFEGLSWMSALKQLKSLSMTESQLRGNLPVSFTALTNLDTLVFYNQQLDQYPAWITRLSSLSYFDLSFSKDKKPVRVPMYLPLDLTALKSLENFQVDYNSFYGPIPDTWDRLTALSRLSLIGNAISGSIPRNFGNMEKLQYLYLDNNQVEAPIPVLTNLTALDTLSLRGNKLKGPMPPSIFQITTLRTLDLSYNELTGTIPPDVTRLVNIGTLSMRNNHFTAGLENVGGMAGVYSIIMDRNNFTGPVPTSLSNLPLGEVSLSGNQFSGTFPDFFLTKTYGLRALDLSYNHFTGSLPQALSQILALEMLRVGHNQFTGQVPLSLTGLTDLIELSLAGNNLQGSFPAYLLRLPKLLHLALDYNNFSGPLPEIKNSTVIYLTLGFNSLSGSLPASIFRLPSLKALVLSNNSFTGQLPAKALFNLTNLESLWLSNNKLNESPPATLWAMKGLTQLLIGGNAFSGSLPTSMCNLQGIVTLDLHSNQFYGPLPTCLYQLSALNSLDVSSNSLYGAIYRNFIGMSPTTGIVNLAYNYFYGLPSLSASGQQYCPGDIPGNSTHSVASPDLAGEGLAGNMLFPDTLLFPHYSAGSASLEDNCLSVLPMGCTAGQAQRPAEQCTAFCNTIPTDSLSTLSSAASTSSTLAPCDSHGVCLPSWVFPPESLPPNAPPFMCNCSEGYYSVIVNGASTCTLTAPASGSLSTGALVGIIIGSCLAAAILAVVLAVLLRPRRRRWSDLDVCTEFTLAQITAATNNFSEESALGEGGFAVVYKGTSPQGQLWAVKRSKVMSNDFETEVRAIAALNHRNLVRLLGFCMHMDIVTGKQEQILVYEFVSNGDLERHISNGTLSFQQIVEVGLGAAEGLAYLHNFPEPIVHRDIKPQNILLTEECQAKIADFGLLRRLTEGDNQLGAVTRVAGTPGYVDPDYTRTNRLTMRSDVYCLGVVLLQMLSGQSVMPTNSDSHITAWANQLMQEYKLTSLVRSDLEATEEQTVTFTDIALDCVKLPGTRRPEMKDVARRLATLLSELDGDDKREAEEEEKARMLKKSAGATGSAKSFMESVLDEIEEETRMSLERSDILASKSAGNSLSRLVSTGKP